MHHNSPFTETSLPVLWDPSDPIDLHFEQTAYLQLMYHHVQTVIHQPFIPLLSGSSNPSSLSLTICKHAARSVSRILDAKLKRGLEMSASDAAIGFPTGVTSILTIWDVKKNALKVDISGPTADLETCIRTLQAAERRLVPRQLWILQVADHGVVKMVHSGHFDVCPATFSGPSVLKVFLLGMS